MSHPRGEVVAPRGARSGRVRALDSWWRAVNEYSTGSGEPDPVAQRSPVVHRHCQARPELRPNGLLAFVAVGLGVLLLAAIWQPPSVSAAVGEYEVQVCAHPNSARDEVVAEDDMIGGVAHTGELFFECSPAGLSASLLRQQKHGEVAGGERWTIGAPLGTRIHQMKLEHFIRHSSESFMHWELLAGGRPPLVIVEDDGHAFPPDSTREETFTVDTDVVGGDLFCPFSRCPGGGIDVELQNFDLVLQDLEGPTLFGPVLPGGTVRGTINIGYSATDRGSGIDQASLSVDGKPLATAHDENGGKCKPPFEFLVPCRLLVNSSFALDTTDLAEGRHEVEVAVTDASGRKTPSSPVAITVHNAPTSIAHPAVSGTAVVGQQLSADPGRWEGAPTEFAYQWLRCPPGVRPGDTTGCAPIAEATSPRYALGGEDVGARDLVLVTATNPQGSGTDISAPSDIVAQEPTTPHKPPVISHVTISHKRFRVVTASARKGRGALLSFSSNKPGHLTLAIERLRGKKAKPFAKLAAVIKAGRSSVPLTGQIGKRRMAPGRWQITITVKDAHGAVSEPARVPFAILPG